MSSYRAHRASSKDIDSVRPLCIEATSGRASLWSVRREPLDPAAWIAAHVPLVVVSEGPSPVGFAAAVTHDIPLAAPRCAEAIGYVTPAHRRKGAARVVMSELLAAVRAVGLWKLVAYAFPEDVAARALLSRADFREVGTLVKHVQIEGGWRDVAVHERLVLAARKSFPSFGDT
jgi:L-amino acid N-acyltransferase YncA